MAVAELKPRHHVIVRKLGVWLGVSAAVGRVWAAPADAPPADPVCGFTAGPHFYYEADQVKQGVVVELEAGPERPNQPVTLRFFVRQKPRDFPVDRLQIEHQKFMHVIGVREDLTGFFHLHPARISPGVWEATQVFPRGGKYKIWVDVKYRGISYSFGQALLPVPGAGGERSNEPAPPDCATNSGYEIRLAHPEEAVCDRTNQLEFTINDAAGNPAQLENYLGAPMHLVLVRDDLSVYLHAHPEGRIGLAQAIRFRQNFPKPGSYRLFAQFRPHTVQLPPEETLLAEFHLQVAPTATAR